MSNIVLFIILLICSGYKTSEVNNKAVVGIYEFTIANLSHICDGALIHRDWIITAEKCKPSDLIFTVGTYYVKKRVETSSDTEERLVKGWISKNFKPKKESLDFVLLHLEYSFPVTRFERDILPVEENKNIKPRGSFKECSWLVWGDESKEKTQEIALEEVSERICDEYSVKSSENIICNQFGAQYFGGKLGGPLICETHQVAVHTGKVAVDETDLLIFTKLNIPFIRSMLLTSKIESMREEVISGTAYCCNIDTIYSFVVLFVSLYSILINL